VMREKNKKHTFDAGTLEAALDVGFLEPAREAGLAALDAGLDAGLDTGFAEALEDGLAATLEVGFRMEEVEVGLAFEAGLAYRRMSKNIKGCHRKRDRPFSPLGRHRRLPHHQVFF